MKVRFEKKKTKIQTVILRNRKQLQNSNNNFTLKNRTIFFLTVISEIYSTNIIM